MSRSPNLETTPDGRPRFLAGPRFCFLLLLAVRFLAAAFAALAFLALGEAWSVLMCLAELTTRTFGTFLREDSPSSPSPGPILFVSRTYDYPL